MTIALLTTTEVFVTEDISREYVSISNIEPVYSTEEHTTVVTLVSEEKVLVEGQDLTVVVTGIMGPQGIPGVSEEDQMYSKRVDFVDDNNLYKAEAPVGSGESTAVWRIRKIVIGGDGDVTETWASGTADFNKQWSLRATYTYI